jgi:isopenicillin N synthase-like dioxygenase
MTASRNKPDPGAGAGHSVPLIDVAELRGGSAAQVEKIAREIREACSSVGFFYVVGHGVPRRLIDSAFDASRSFFAQPPEGKRESKVNSVYHGFTEMRTDELWGTRNIAPFETFAIGTELSPEELSRLPEGSFMGPNVWPASMPALRTAALEYFRSVTRSAADVLRAMAISLGATPDFFTAQFQRSASVCTMLHYPPLPASAGSEWVSSTPHTDADCITFLAQDSNGGLQVQKRGSDQWIDVPPIEGSFVVNIGDLMARWSNDRFTSTTHRVVNRSGRERYSIATFNNPDPEAVVDPRHIGVSDADCRYPAITAGAYMAEYMRQIYAARASTLQRLAANN